MSDREGKEKPQAANFKLQGTFNVQKIIWNLDVGAWNFPEA
jgi:hypothetical protein